jgi:hypothetical protein
VLFNGLDQNGDPQLWVTNGTAVGGTYQLTGVAGANASASASGIAPSDLTVFNGEVFFSGRDTTGHFQLWETNGAVAGTTEVTTAPTFRQNLAPSNLKVYNGQVLFSGLDPDGFFRTLWTTNGTAAGTHEILPPGSNNTFSYSFDPVDLTAIGTTTSETPSLSGIVWRKRLNRGRRALEPEWLRGLHLG